MSKNMKASAFSCGVSARLLPQLVGQCRSPDRQRRACRENTTATLIDRHLVRGRELEVLRIHVRLGVRPALGLRRVDGRARALVRTSNELDLVARRRAHDIQHPVRASLSDCRPHRSDPCSQDRRCSSTSRSSSRSLPASARRHSGTRHRSRCCASAEANTRPPYRHTSSWRRVRLAVWSADSDPPHDRITMS